MSKLTDYIKSIITFIATLDAGIARVHAMTEQVEKQLVQINNIVEQQKIKA